MMCTWPMLDGLHTIVDMKSVGYLFALLVSDFEQGIF
jgi:hypothetical protein